MHKDMYVAQKPYYPNADMWMQAVGTLKKMGSPPGKHYCTSILTAVVDRA